jgi:predicted RNA polymerase sigma factor
VNLKVIEAMTALEVLMNYFVVVTINSDLAMNCERSACERSAYERSAYERLAYE